MTPQTPRFALISTVLTLLVLVLIWQLPKLLTPATSADTLQLHAAGCLLNHHRCSAREKEQQVELSVEADTIQSLTPLPFVAALSGLEADTVTLVLEGKEMFMGVNQIPMTQQPDGTWQATTELAVCTTGKMVWLANIIIERANQRPVKATFEFEAR